MELTNQVTSTDRPGSNANATVSQLGFWSAVLTAFFAAAFFALAISTPVRDVPYPYVASLPFTDYIWMYPGFLLAPTFIVLMACIHAYASDDKKVFSQIALSFAVIYAAVILTNYFIAWTVFQASVSSGETAGLSLLSGYNPRGIFVALEGLGYLALNGAFLFAAVVFTGGRLERALRWLLVISFVVAVGSFASIFLLGYGISGMYGLAAFELAVVAVSCTVLIVAGALLSIVFKRAGR